MSGYQSELIEKLQLERNRNEELEQRIEQLDLELDFFRTASFEEVLVWREKNAHPARKPPGREWMRKDLPEIVHRAIDILTPEHGNLICRTDFAAFIFLSFGSELNLFVDQTGVPGELPFSLSLPRSETCKFNEAQKEAIEAVEELLKGNLRSYQPRP